MRERLKDFTHRTVRLDGRHEPAVNDEIRRGISVRLRKIGQTYSDGNLQLANHYVRELYEFKKLNQLRPAR
jgi:hypothetical protein